MNAAAPSRIIHHGPFDGERRSAELAFTRGGEIGRLTNVFIAVAVLIAILVAGAAGAYDAAERDRRAAVIAKV